jgi:hypothetical protein
VDNFIKISERPSEGLLPTREHFIPTGSISHITQCKVRKATIVVLKNGAEIPTDEVTAYQLVRSRGIAGSVFTPDGEWLNPNTA